jgi:hypothetical protein
MTAREQAAVLAPYARQLLDDKNVQSAARQAAQATGDIYRRARGKDVAEVVQDKKLRRRVADATESVGELWLAITEPPRKPTHRLRSAFLVLLTAGVAAVLFNRQLRGRLLETVGGKKSEPEGPSSGGGET